MIICKSLEINDPIRTTDEWFSKCPPQGKEVQWKDGRSAKETAKHWINGAPSEFLNLVKPLGVCIDVVYPEHVTHFDANGGNGRNHDLLIIGKDKANKKVVISVESKADEPFGKYISEYKKEIAKKIAGGINTNAGKRINELLPAIVLDKYSSQTDQIRYQLLTAIAGTFAEAKEQNAETAIFIIQTFISKEINKDKHEQNQKDLNYFLNLISDGKYSTIKDGDLLNIGKFPGNNSGLDKIELYIGKIDIKI